MSDTTNGYLDTPIDWITGVKNIRLKDIPSFIRTDDRGDIMLNYFIHETHKARTASAIIINTFSDFERPVLDALSDILSLPIYTVGPLCLLLTHHLPTDSPLSTLGSSLWKEETNYLTWLDDKQPDSVVLVNFGSITTMTSDNLVEFAWGLANSNANFMWVIRPDLVKGESAVLPKEFMSQIEGRGLLASWCNQEAVLMHPSVGSFLTHCGWNSTLETVSGGVPTMCWPFFAEQQTNCRYLCTEWGMGVEVGDDVRREEVERVVREVMEGEKGKEIRSKARDWKEKAIRATKRGGSSFDDFERLVKEVLIPN